MTAVLLIASIALLGWVLYRAGLIAMGALREGEGRLRYDETELLDLVGEKEAALDVLRTSALDFEMGKVADPDYDRVRDEESAEAIEIMQRLDQVRSSFEYTDRVAADLEQLELAPVELPEAGARGAEAPIVFLDETRPDDDGVSAAARMRRRLNVPAMSCSSCGAEIEPGDKFCGQCGESLASACANCGNPLKRGAKFCSECGQRTARAAKVSR